jgi:serine/threonine-protein kinase PpkA
MNIPGYRIEHELGHGGMSTVYLAEQESLHRKVALKVMAPALAADRSFGERFLREARTVAQLTHPNILAVYDIGSAGHSYYLAMEYVPGGDLKHRVRQGALPPEQALAILKQIAAALGYAHQKGFVHRDVKPENILFREDGTAVLTDFGIAKAVGSGTKMTGTGMTIGTAHYMSPEQARGKGVDGRSDLYSLGIVLFEMLTGKAPYDADDTMAIAFAHVHDPVPELPSAFCNYQPLIDRLLAKTLSDRFADAGALIGAVEKLQAGETLVSSAPKTEVIQQVAEHDQSANPGGNREPDTGNSGLKWGLGGVLLALLLVGAIWLSKEPTNKIVQGRPSVSASAASPVVATQLELAEQHRKQTIEKLLGEAKKDLNAMRLTTPVGNSAADKYKRVQELDADNLLAQKGLKEIGSSYIKLTEKAIMWGDFDKAKKYLSLAKKFGANAQDVRLKSGQIRVLDMRTAGPIDAKTDMEFMQIPSGCFKMGSNVGDDNERPVHQVCVEEFFLGKYEVTVRQFRKFIEATNYHTDAEKNGGSEIWTGNKWERIAGVDWQRSSDGKSAAKDNHPVVHISWDDADAFRKWMCQQSGKNYRLPSEAEWEYAAKGGEQHDYSGTNSENMIWKYAWYWENSSGLTQPVGQKFPNPYGLYDMTGNVWEWVQDEYHTSYDGAPSDGHAWHGRGGVAVRVCRGGSWSSGSSRLRVAFRFSAAHGDTSSTRGFRLALTGG